MLQVSEICDFWERSRGGGTARMRKKVAIYVTRRQCRTLAGILWPAVQVYFSARLSVPLGYHIVFSRKRWGGEGGGKDTGVKGGGGGEDVGIEGGKKRRGEGKEIALPPYQLMNTVRRLTLKYACAVTYVSSKISRAPQNRKLCAYPLKLDASSWRASCPASTRCSRGRGCGCRISEGVSSHVRGRSQLFCLVHLDWAGAWSHLQQTN